jgi:16S rRNA (guanine966-N2)-methyltransferase
VRLPSAHVTRPTAGRLREALFSMLEAAEADFTSVLDLYAGSGALGLEALSRGAAHVTFVERDPRAVTVLRGNVEALEFDSRATVVGHRVGTWRPAPGEAYTLVLADPPYDDATAWAAIERSVRGILAPSAFVVVEHAARVAPPDELAGLPRWRDRRQGEGAVAIYRPPFDGDGSLRGEDS